MEQGNRILLKELQKILDYMIYYNIKDGYLEKDERGVLAFFESEPSLEAIYVTKQDIKILIDECLMPVKQKIAERERENKPKVWRIIDKEMEADRKTEKQNGAGRPKRYPEGTKIVTITRNVIEQHIPIIDALIEELKREIQIKK